MNIRWLKLWGIDLASEKKQRDLMNVQLKDIQIESEAIPFSFETRRGGPRELRPAVMGYVFDIKALLFHALEENNRFEHMHKS